MIEETMEFEVPMFLDEERRDSRAQRIPSHVWAHLPRPEVETEEQTMRRELGRLRLDSAPAAIRNERGPTMVGTEIRRCSEFDSALGMWLLSVKRYSKAANDPVECL